MFVTFDAYGTLIDWEEGAWQGVPDRGLPRRVHDRT